MKTRSLCQNPGIRAVVASIVAALAEIQDDTVDQWCASIDAEPDPVRELALWIGIASTFTEMKDSFPALEDRRNLYARLVRATMDETGDAIAGCIQRNALKGIEERLRPILSGASS